jgi:predicted GNAT superfamily acetyltransferase
MTIELRDIVDLAGCRAVVAVEEAVWGAGSEIVPASVLLVSAKRGGILIGAFEAARLVGFVWSLAGLRDGRPTHWSHMLAVVPDARGRALGVRLKLAQRERALAQGVDLIEWTFDPLQAANAHLNLARLGAVAGTYLVNAYGEMQGALHRGTPTDRLVAEWWIRDRRVRTRAADGGGERSGPTEGPAALKATRGERWTEPDAARLDLEAPEVLLPVPPRFTEMQREAPDLALRWRLAARDVFTTYFARGYRADDFVREGKEEGGCYVLRLAQRGRGIEP